jgi:hypothetical protein
LRGLKKSENLLHELREVGRLKVSSQAATTLAGREMPEFKVLRRELRDSHEFREALTFGENSEATSAL